MRAPVNAGRTPLFDRAKGLLIALVVLGHAIEVVGASGPFRFVYGAIYLFHMPAFLLVAGALVRRRSLLGEARLVLTRLAPAYLAGLVLAAAVALVLRGDPSVSLLPPPWTLWFLVSLATLRLLATVGPRRFALLAIASALIGALVELPDALSLHRSALLAPFFAAGLLLGGARLGALVDRIGGARGALLLAGSIGGGGLLLVVGGLPRSVLYWRDPLPGEPLVALSFSTLLSLCALGASLGVLALVARLGAARPLERLGAKSLLVYLGHAPLLALVRPALDRAELGFAERSGAIVVLTCAATLLPLLVGAIGTRGAAIRLARPPAAR